MPINKWVIYTLTGEFKFGGFYEPTLPDVNHSIIILPSSEMPDPRTQKWNGSAVVAKTPAEIINYDTKALDGLTLENDYPGLDTLLTALPDIVADVQASKFNLSSWRIKLLGQLKQKRLSKQQGLNG